MLLKLWGLFGGDAEKGKSDDLEDQKPAEEPKKAAVHINSCKQMCIFSEETNDPKNAMYPRYETRTADWHEGPARVVNLTEPLLRKMSKEKERKDVVSTDESFWHCMHLRLLHTYTHTDLSSPESPVITTWKLPAALRAELPDRWMIQEMLICRCFHCEDPSTDEVDEDQEVRLTKIIKTKNIDAVFHYALDSQFNTRTVTNGVSIDVVDHHHSPDRNFFFAQFGSTQAFFETHVLRDPVTNQVLYDGDHVFVKNTLSWQWFMQTPAKEMLQKDLDLCEFVYACVTHAFHHSTLPQCDKLFQLNVREVHSYPDVRVVVGESGVYTRDNLDLMEQVSLKRMYNDCCPYYMSDVVRMPRELLRFFLWILETKVIPQLGAMVTKPEDFEISLNPYPPIYRHTDLTSMHTELDLEIYYLDAKNYRLVVVLVLQVDSVPFAKRQDELLGPRVREAEAHGGAQRAKRPEHRQDERRGEKDGVLAVGVENEADLENCPGGVARDGREQPAPADAGSLVDRHVQHKPDVPQKPWRQDQEPRHAEGFDQFKPDEDQLDRHEEKRRGEE